MSWNKRTKETAVRFIKSKMEKVTGGKEEVSSLKDAAENNISDKAALRLLTQTRVNKTEVFRGNLTKTP